MASSYDTSNSIIFHPNRRSGLSNTGETNISFPAGPVLYSRVNDPIFQTNRDFRRVGCKAQPIYAGLVWMRTVNGAGIDISIIVTKACCVNTSCKIKGSVIRGRFCSNFEACSQVSEYLISAVI